MHVLESRLFSDYKSNLSELSGEQETIRMAESIFVHPDVNISKERKGLDMVVLVHGIVGHMHVMLMDSQSLDTTKVDCLLLGVVLDNFKDREAVDGMEMLVDTIPNSASGRGGVVEVHSHSGPCPVKT